MSGGVDRHANARLAPHAVGRKSGQACTHMSESSRGWAQRVDRHAHAAGASYASIPITNHRMAPFPRAASRTRGRNRDCRRARPSRRRRGDSERQRSRVARARSRSQRVGNGGRPAVCAWSRHRTSHRHRDRCGDFNRPEPLDVSRQGDRSMDAARAICTNTPWDSRVAARSCRAVPASRNPR